MKLEINIEKVAEKCIEKFKQKLLEDYGVTLEQIADEIRSKQKEYDKAVEERYKEQIRKRFERKW